MNSLDRTSELPDILTIAQVASVLHCSKAHAYKIIKGQVKETKPIPVITMGRRKVVLGESLLRWISEQERTAC